MRASPYQERFWLEWQLDPLSAKYNETFVYRIKGYLKFDLLKNAFERLAQKHLLLRSQFYRGNDELNIQVIENFVLPVDVLNVKGGESVTNCNSLQQVSNAPFDLRCGPLWRAGILRVHEQEFWLVISLHHIIIDGNSFEILRHDLSQFYNQPGLDGHLGVAEYNHEMKEYFDPERRTVEDEVTCQGLRYYAEKLADQSLYYNLGESSQGQAIFLFSLGDKASQQIEEFCLENNCGPFRFIAAVFAIFLFCYFGQKKFCMTYPVNLRKKGVPAVFGSFMNMQLLPLMLGLDSNFHQVFSQISESRTATKELTLPYEKLINYFKQKKIIELSDAANIVVSETDLKLSSLSLGGLEVESIQLSKTALPYDISLEYECYKGEIYLRLSIKKHWFSVEHHKEQLKQHFCSIINAAHACPQLPLQQLPLVEPIQQQEMLKLSAQSEFFHACDMRIERWFEQIVRQYPERVAIIEQDKKITYSQLAAIADKCCEGLKQKLPDEIKLVGISMQHSAGLIAAILALFKLGKAYLPIRPDLPLSYVGEVANQADLKFIITDCAFRFKEDMQLTTCMFMDLLVETTKCHNPIKQSNSDIAYVLYTSGTTGTPKGVMIKHASIVNLIVACQPFYHFSPQDVVPWFHSYGFDFSVWEIWSVLLNGGTLLILDEMSTKSPREFTKQVAQHAVTVINQTPTALKQWGLYLSQTGEALPELSSVRAVISGGEALYPHHVEALLLKKTPLRCKIFNMYGITEDCVHSTILEVTLAYLKQPHSILGKMLPGKWGRVVDESGRVKPLGCPGELLISGYGVAAGYFNQPLMTQERFIRLTDAEGSTAIWFKTGDQVRLLPSGEFEYIGRNDSQTKIRGYRLDYKDIEVRLSRIPAVADIKILVDADEVIAFVVVTERVAMSDVAALARTNLPYYMVPSRFIKMDRLPRTMNNKVDERELLRMSKLPAEIELRKAEITDTTITKIADIWRNLLPNRVFELDDNFFDCGGNSILLVMLQDRIEKTFSIKLSVVDFFSHPCIIDMAKMVKQHLKAE